jgi:hypothetical protein
MLGRVHRPFIASALLATSLFVTARPAAATTIEDIRTKAHLTLDTPGAKVCVILPVESRGGSECGDFDVEAAAAKIGQGKQDISGVAAIVFPDWTLAVTLRSSPGTTVHSADEIQGFIRGLKESGDGLGLARNNVRVHGEGPDVVYDLGKVNELNYLRLHVDYDVPADSPLHFTSRTIVYVLDGDQTSQMVMFSTDPDHEARARPIAAAIIGTVVMSPSRVESYGQSRSFAVGRAVGRLALPVLALLAILGVKKWQSRKKAARPG